jgi:hypothetical protein
MAGRTCCCFDSGSKTIITTRHREENQRTIRISLHSVDHSDKWLLRVRPTSEGEFAKMVSFRSYGCWVRWLIKPDVAATGKPHLRNGTPSCLLDLGARDALLRERSHLAL